MMPWRSTLISFLRRLEIYELATIIMSSAILILFIFNGSAFHEAFGLTTTSHVLLGNIGAVYHDTLSWVFTLTLPILVCIYFFSARTANLWLRKTRGMVRILISFSCMMAIYKIVIFYIRVFNPVNRDTILQHIDTFLFGGRLPSEWIAPIANPSLTIFFFAVYMSWFALTYITLFFMWRHSQKAVEEYVAATLIAFYIGYITYAIVPAIGPIFTVHYQNSLGSIVQILTGEVSYLPRDCFPSLHTGISIVMLFFINRYRKDLLKPYLVFTILIIASTQYLRVHYGIDVIAGAALGISVSIFTPNWVHKWALARLMFQDSSKSSIPSSTHTTESVSELA